MIWFDLDNSPHIPLFRPIFHELESRNKDIFITAREFAQTKQLLDFWKIQYKLVGKHGGKSKILKISNLLSRGYQLKKHIQKKNISLAVSHGSRTQLLASSLANIKAIWILDYEYTEIRLANFFASNILMPVYIPDKRLKSAGFNLKKIIRYNGFKEELYLNDFQPDCNFRKELNVSEDNVLVIFRPPSMVANYHNSRSEDLLINGLKYFSNFKDVVCLITCRTSEDKEFILSQVKDKKNIRFLDKPVDGLQLLYHADIAISGGGTMNREAALLGTETYSIFTGKRPYLDELLFEQKRLNFITNTNDFGKIKVEKKSKEKPYFSNKLSVELSDLILNLERYK